VTGHARHANSNANSFGCGVLHCNMGMIIILAQRGTADHYHSGCVSTQLVVTTVCDNGGANTLSVPDHHAGPQCCAGAWGLEQQVI